MTELTTTTEINETEYECVFDCEIDSYRNITITSARISPYNKIYDLCKDEGWLMNEEIMKDLMKEAENYYSHESDRQKEIQKDEQLFNRVFDSAMVGML